MVWTIRNGYRYFENKSEYEVNRMFRIRGNNEAMVESDEEVVHRYELGIEPYEVVEEEFGPVEGHTVPSAKKKQKVTHSSSQKKVALAPRPVHDKDLNLVLFKRDFGVNRVPQRNPRKRKRFTQVIAEAVKDLLADDTEDLIIEGPHLTTEVVPDVVDDEVVPELVPEVVLDEKMKPSYDILNNFDNLTEQQFKEQMSDTPSETPPSPEWVDDRSLETQPEEVPPSPKQSLKIQPEEVPSPPPRSPDDFDWLARITPDPNNPGEMMVRPSPIVERRSLTPPLPTADPLYEPVLSMMPPKHNYPVKPNLDYIQPLPSDPPKEPEPPNTPAEPEPPNTPAEPEPPNTPAEPEPPNTPAEPELEEVAPPATTTTSGKDTTQKRTTRKRREKKKSNTNGKEVAIVEKKSNTKGKEVAIVEKKSSTKGKEVAIVEKKSSTKGKEVAILENKISTKGEEVAILEKKSSTKGKEVAIIEKKIEPEEMSVAVNRHSSRLSNRPNYADPVILEDVHFWCWQCKDDVINICALHGDLTPCSEVITAPGTKNPLTFPRPSFIDIRRSEIRDAGYGAFATGFIRPGVILGEYKGKVIRRQDYVKIKESGYAWEVSDPEGFVSYIDGAGHRASNWLKFVNCCRGEDEQNTISRLNQGQIEYYTYKPIAIGHELKIFYGLKYFTDLGYDPTPDEENKKGAVYSCTKCNKQWNDKEYLATHRCSANKQFKCDQCDKAYSKKHWLTEHIKTAHLGQGHQCTQCGKQYSQEANLRRHISSVHEGVKQFNCPFCYYSTNYKHVLTWHVNTHTDTKPQQCPHCEYSCVSTSHLSKHISTQHNSKKHPCNYNGCSVKCDSEEELTVHYHTHPKRQYQCGECPMSFDQNWHLSQHTAKHTGEKNYQCQYCEKRFVNKGDLTRHILIHTGVKDFKCDNCGRQFNKKSSMDRHTKSRVCSK